MPNVISPKHIAAGLTELWSPRVIGEVDDAYIKVASVRGSLAWHSHEREVPKGVRHNPVAEEECHLLLVERKSTLHTGDVTTDKTRSVAEQLRPI
jgi:hypothetical protein